MGCLLFYLTVNHELTVENCINAVQNEQILWNSELNASEEDKD